MFEVSIIQKENAIETYHKWQDEHGFHKLSEALLPSTFFVCLKDGVPIYMMPFWNTDSGYAIIAYAVSNIRVPYPERTGGLDALIFNMCLYAKDNGYSAVFSSTASKPVIKSLTAVGFVKGDDGTGQYFLRL